MEDYFSVRLPEDTVLSLGNTGIAHIGDAVYELLTRSYLCIGGKTNGKNIHRATVELVCAPTQARLCEHLLPLLTEEEREIFRRGRNTNVHFIPHNATRAEYQKATALEMLFGLLYLTGRKERANELFCAMMEGYDAT